MKEYPPLLGVSLVLIADLLRTITKVRKEDVIEMQNLQTRFVRGRLRTDRTTPTSNSNVVAGVDKEGDVVRTATYQYIVVNDAGTLKWARHAIDVTW